MANDTAITRLLYAILSQKCLKDIDWNKVARDPILAQEITNGHAARMRYSRFKRQMDGTTGIVKRQRNPASAPRKPRSAPKPKAKSKSTQKKEEEMEHGLSPQGIKRDPIKQDPYGEHSGSGEDRGEYSTPDTPEADSNMLPTFVKTEPGIRRTHLQRDVMIASPRPRTPHASAHAYSREQTPTPSPTTSFGMGNQHYMGEMDEGLWTSFGMQGPPALYSSPLMQGGADRLGMPHHSNVDLSGISMHTGLGDPFREMWGEAEENGDRDEDVSGGEERFVKREPRWEGTYTQL